MPSAIPRNMEKVPRVTIKGGRFRREIAMAFNPPPRHPARSAAPAAAGSGKCQSCQAAPKMTAASAIMEPTERSMPPVTITGVMATASRPSSTLKRVTSKKLLPVKKFWEMVENTATSASSASNRTHSPLGNKRSRHGLCAAGGKAVSMLSRTGTQTVDGHRSQNDRALYGAFPIGADAEECERRADRAQ